MIKRTFATLIFVVTLIFTGCGENDAESKLEIQQMLDNGDYTGVIAKLEGVASTDSEYIALGAAYMGKSGIGLSSLITIIANSSDQTDAFADFIKSIDEEKSSTALSDLTNSVRNYVSVLSGVCEDSTITLTDSQKDICLYKGLAQSMKATASIGYLIEDISVITTSGSVDDKLEASLCSMQYAYDGTVLSGCTITTDTNVTFVESNSTYTAIAAAVNTSTYDFLITSTSAGTTAITSGYCTLSDFTSRDTNMTYSTKTTGYYVCPLDESGDEDLTTTALLVTALNGGFDSIIASIGGVSSDISTDIENFRAEISTDGNSTITISEIITYLNLKNN